MDFDLQAGGSSAVAETCSSRRIYLRIAHTFPTPKSNFTIITPQNIENKSIFVVYDLSLVTGPIFRTF